MRWLGLGEVESWDFGIIDVLCGNQKWLGNPRTQWMFFFLMGKSSTNGAFSIAIFDCHWVCIVTPDFILEALQK